MTLHIKLLQEFFTTVKPETLTSGNFDEFSKSGSNHQTLTFQSKATKQNKHTI